MKAQDLMKEIKEHLSLLAAKTAVAGSSKEILEYLAFTSKFYNYSYNNIQLIYMQRPDATMVKGYRAWNSVGRYVKKGSKGIPILAPCFYKAKEGSDEEDRLYFRVVYVHDVKDTDGQPIPESPWLARGDDKGLLEALELVAERRKIQVEYEGLSPYHHGSSYIGKIVIDSSLDAAGKGATLAHEIAHEILHDRQDRIELSKRQKETEAEATAYVVMSHFGLETKAENYLHLWDIGPEEIIEAFERIHVGASDLINEIHQILAEKAEVNATHIS